MSVGFYAGRLFCEMGPREEMQSLFINILKYVVPLFPNEDWALVQERLYRRYVHFQETSDVRASMHIVSEHFASLPFSPDDEVFRQLDRNNSALNWSAATLAEAYDAYFDAFDDVCDEIQLDNLWDGIAPLRILITDSPEVYFEMDRPLWIYDEMDGPPLWLVPVSEREDEDEEDEP